MYFNVFNYFKNVSFILVFNTFLQRQATYSRYVGLFRQAAIIDELIEWY